MNTVFEKIFLTLVLIGTAIVLFGFGDFFGEYRTRNELQETAAKHCGAKFDELTGDFAWIECPPPVSPTAPEVVAPEPDPEEPVAPVEAVPPTLEKPNEPVY